MATASTVFCTRCQRDCSVHLRYPRLRHVAKAYLAIPILLTPILPIMASDYVVALPTLMIYCFGIGPVLAIITDKPTCAECGCEMDKWGRPPGVSGDPANPGAGT